MKTHMRRPESLRLPLADGHWLLVKKFLTAGEERRMSSRSMILRPGEKPEIDFMQLGTSTIVEYLIDWSLLDPDGALIVIRDQPANVVAAALDGLDPDGFVEVQTAINAHVEAMAALKEQEKKEKAIESASSAISTSAA
jgi:hypothetical protein